MMLPSDKVMVNFRRVFRSTLGQFPIMTLPQFHYQLKTWSACLFLKRNPGPRAHIACLPQACSSFPPSPASTPSASGWRRVGDLWVCPASLKITRYKPAGTPGPGPLSLVLWSPRVPGPAIRYMSRYWRLRLGFTPSTASCP